MYLKSPVQREYLFLRYHESAVAAEPSYREDRPHRAMGSHFPRASNEMTVIAVVHRKIGIIHWGKEDSWYFIISQLIPLIGRSNI